ncbi:EAL domain, c-di-GMP-specific phosphodiesterase class I (or its enzymatically inactive variant) [Halopseudomonas sabulinigri]|uniref:EAL domain, c-di-GMP-specific phosphodiesterase class I (Or its enzymatically inactive variant) n=1 Tax=Halopseudomonas sabulinigri TaxID=472181 RepID=A0A1H1PPH7_9GAMM|nr:EAL domain-containing protein [Halopseudomonas sabulinigri]SDS13221.1 EAL domain, c-di-GMP-specific phosphodiesterase class I (or its enzymatically inactive variant) [Halopseudomonas sabulinigri]
MRVRYLRTRLIVTSVGLLALVLGAVFLAVYTSTNFSAKRQAQHQLEVGGKVFSNLLEARARELTNATQILVADFGFRQAVATGDLPTIRSALQNQVRRIGADQAMFFDVQGALQTSSAGNEGGSRAEVEALQAFSEQAFIAVIDHQPYLLVEAVVRAPVPVGQVAMVFSLDAALARELQKLTGLEIRFISSRDEEIMSTYSTSPYAQQDMDLQEGTRTLEGEGYLTTVITLLDQAPYSVSAQLASPLSEALASFDDLKRELLIITLVALLASSLLAVRLSGSLARPVTLLAEAARRIGRGDYTSKVGLARDDELGLLADSIDTMRSGIAEREELIAHNAMHDPLTGLPNVSVVRERLRGALISGQKGVLAQCNLVSAELMAKARGQDFMDTLVCQSVSHLHGHLPADALLAWQPGVGFLLLLEHRELDEAVVVVDEMLGKLGEKIQVDDIKLRSQWLAGVVSWPLHGSDANDLLRQASIALADAAPGPERIAVYQAQRDQAYQRRIRLARDLRYAAQYKELSAVYQPKLDLASGEVRQVEALMRWNHSELGPISPDEFITLAEQTGSIGMLTQWMMAAVASQLRNWIERGIHLQVAMNISARDLDDPQFPQRIEKMLQAQQISPDYLALEVTESAVMTDPERNLSSLRALRDLGIELAVDDYGTGYSSLATLKSLPVQDLKIDKSFVLQLAEGGDDAVIVKSTIELAHNMGLKVIAEGIENSHSLNWLKERHCDVAQGYFISRPLAVADLERWLDDTRGSFGVVEPA